MISVMKNTATAATFAYVERVFRYLASLRYFFDREDRLLAFVSRAERNMNQDVMNRILAMNWDTLEHNEIQKHHYKLSIKFTVK